MSHIKAFQIKEFFYPGIQLYVITGSYDIITTVKTPKRALVKHSSQVLHITSHNSTPSHISMNPKSELTCSEAVVWACGRALAWAPVIPA